MLNYNIRNDYYVERYFEEKELSEFTQETYEKELIKFCKAVKRPLKDIIDDCKDQQGIETEEILDSINRDGKKFIQRRVVKFDVDGPDSLILQYLKQFENYCKSKGNKNTTINSGLDTIRAVLSHFKVELPNFPNLKDDSADWEVLSKEDLKFILADSSLMHKSLTLFMLSTGFRIYDCLSLTIGDYMEATSDFHDFVEVDDFIDNAPDNMRGYWDFEPHKTKNKHTLCKTFNSEESNKFILQNLRRLKNDYMPRKSKRIKKELKLTKSDSLFGSKQGCYKKSPTVQSISTMFGRKNKELYVWHINKINQNIKEGKISSEDYDKYVDLIPKFHPHACRKYFCTMIERHTSNERRYRLMEGHAPKNKLDKSYINISKDEIKEVYDDAVIDLSVYLDDNDDIEKLRDDFNQKLADERIKHEEETENLKKEYEEKIKELELNNSNLNNQVNNIETRLNNIARANDITKIQEHASKHELVNKYNLMESVIKIYNEDIEKNPNLFVDENYIEYIIIRAYNRQHDEDLKIISDSTITYNMQTQILDRLNEIANNYIKTLGFSKSKYIEQKLYEKFWKMAVELEKNGLDESSIDDNEVIAIVKSIIT